MAVAELNNIICIRKCTNCGCDIEIKHKKRMKTKTVFCSKLCESEYRKKQTKPNCECSVCGKLLHRKPSQIKKNKNICCSPECLKVIRSKLMTGENNHQYGLKGRENASWKNDEKISYYGYKLIRKLDHPFKDCEGYVFEHKLVAEQYLLTDENSFEFEGKRYLKKEYCVHHLNFKRLDNRVDNLYVLLRTTHVSFHNSLKDIIRDEKGRITKIEIQNYSEKELINLFYDFIRDKQISKQ